MLQQEIPGDYVLSMGIATSVRCFVELAAPHFGFDIVWRGRGADTIATDTKSGRAIVRVARHHYRPAEVDNLVGCSRRAAEQFGWRPTVAVAELAAIMAAEDDRRVRNRVTAY